MRKKLPVNALNMISLDKAQKNDAQIAFDNATKLPPIPKEKLNTNIPKHIELCEHMFEFQGHVQVVVKHLILNL